MRRDSHQLKRQAIEALRESIVELLSSREELRDPVHHQLPEITTELEAPWLDIIARVHPDRIMAFERAIIEITGDEPNPTRSISRFVVDGLSLLFSKEPGADPKLAPVPMSIFTDDKVIRHVANQLDAGDRRRETMEQYLTGQQRGR